MTISRTARVGFIAALLSVGALVAVLLRSEHEDSSKPSSATPAGVLQESALEAASDSRAPSEPDAIAALVRRTWTRDSSALPLLPAAGGFETHRASPREGAASSWSAPSDAVSKIGSSRGAGFSVSWRGKGLDVRPAFGHDSAAVSSDGLIVYPEISEGMHSVVMALPQGLEEFLVLDDASIAPNFEYIVALPGWVTRVRETAQGTIEFWDGEAAWLRADAPEAKDAAGKTFPGRARVTELAGREEAVASGRQWVVKGGELRITFEMDLSGATGPVVVDPGWSATGSMAASRLVHSATLLPDGKILVAGGSGNLGSLSVCELYDPATGTWSGTGSLGAARIVHTATLLPNGKVLVAGGLDSVSLASSELYDPASGTWSSTGAMATGRYNHTATLLPGGRVLVAGGNSFSVALASSELYDPVSGMWSATGTMTTTRAVHTATLLPDGQVLATGGINGIDLSSCERYDPVSGTWTATGPMSTERGYHTATLLPSGLVLVAGGLHAGYLSSCELYDPAGGSWSPTGSMTTGRHVHTATLLPDGKVLIAGGYGNLGTLSWSELYDPASGTSTGTGLMTTERHGHSSTVLPSGKVLVVGGVNDFGLLASAELYDAGGGSWWTTGSMASARYGHSATLLPNGQVLIAGGVGLGVALASCELYDPGTGTCTNTGSMLEVRYIHTATLLPSGKVLVAGGSGTGYLSTSELYDPSTGIWTSTGSMSTARYYCSATLLPSGEVLVAGGYTTVAQSMCERYDPATGTWTATDPLSTARGYHTATLLPSGKVLVAGGYSDTGGFLSSSELYDPSTGTWSGTGALSFSRFFHSATLLPSGQVLVAGGEQSGTLSTCELFDPSSGIWSGTGTMSPGREVHTATLLPNGQVLVAGGYNSGGFLPISSNIYDPASGTWSDPVLMATGSQLQTATLLPSGKVLVAGGYNGTILSSVQLFDPLGAPAVWQPSINSVAGSSSYPVSLVYGTSISVDGVRFKGVSEASGGNGGQNSSSNCPMVRLVGLSSGSFGSLDSTLSRSFAGAATGWATGTSLTFTLPTAANNPDAYYLLYVITNGIPSDGKIVRLSAPSLNDPPVVSVGPAASLITNQTYNGAVAITDPSSTSWNVSVSFGDNTPALVVNGVTTSPLNFAHKYTSAGGSPYTISATVTDNQGAIGSNSVLITVVTPVAEIATDKAKIQALVPAKLSPNNAKLVTQVLDSATLRINQGQPAAAVALLRTFVSYIVRLRSSGALLDPDAQALIDDANAVISGFTP